MSYTKTFEFVRAQLEKAMLLLNQTETDKHTALSWALTYVNKLLPPGKEPPFDVDKYKFIKQLRRDITDAEWEIVSEYPKVYFKDLERALLCVEKADERIDQFTLSSEFRDIEAAFELSKIEQKLTPDVKLRRTT
jgi:hypothetical protein